MDGLGQDREPLRRTFEAEQARMGQASFACIRDAEIAGGPPFSVARGPVLVPDPVTPVVGRL